jgi:Skp family chaperone for outer membrane proteins
MGATAQRTRVAWALALASLAVSPAAAGNVGLVDLTFVFQQHPGFRQQLEGIKGQVEAFERDAQRQRAHIDGQRERLATYRAGSPEYRRLDEAITKQSANLRVQMALKRKDIMEQEAAVYYRTYLEVIQVVQSIATSRGLELVLRFERDGTNPAAATDPQQTIKLVNRPVVFHEQLDISQLVVQELHRTRITQVPAAGPRVR